MMQDPPAPDPADLQARFEASVALRRAGRFAEAVPILREICRALPAGHLLNRELGAAAMACRDWPAAIPALESWLSAHPADGEIWFNLGVAQWQAGRPQPALASAELAEALGFAPARLFRIEKSVELGKWPDALAAIDRLLAAGSGAGPGTEPGAGTEAEIVTRALAFRIQILVAQDRIGEAEQALVAIDPTAAASHPAVRTARASIAAWRGDDGPALAALDQVLQQDPAHRSARMLRAAVHLARGDFARGWADHDRRAALPVAGPALPEWRGGGPAETRILVQAEQGLGDQIQFARYLPWLLAGWPNAALACGRRMQPLFRDSGIPVVDAATPPDGFAARVMLADLPSIHWQAVGANLYPAAPYLRPSPAAWERWRDRLGSGQELDLGPGQRPDRRIAVNWKGAGDVLRDVPLDGLIRALAPAATGAGVEIIVIQPDLTAAEHAICAAAGWRMIADLDREAAFCDSAAILDHCDLVITSDTSIAHLAGALGRPVWTLLRTPADWRWMRDRSDSPWYPGMRLFRQPHAGAWGPVLDAVAAAVRSAGLGPP